MRRNNPAIIAVAVALGMAFASQALAQGMGPGGGMGRGGMGGGGGMGMMMGPVVKLCAKEIEKHCAQVQPGPALRSCLEAKSQSKELSENCETALDSTGPNRGMGTGPVARLCVAEIDKFCAEVEHVNGQVRMCLEKRRAELGEACTVALDNTGPGRWMHQQQNQQEKK